MGTGHRANHALQVLFSLVLFACGALSLWLAHESATMVRRFLSPAIRSAAALAGAKPGQTILLPGRIDRQTSDLEWGLAIFDRERRSVGPPTCNRYGGRIFAQTWVSQGRHRPPFSLVTAEGRVPIINGGYAIERAGPWQEIGSDRYAGFWPGDEVLVVGEIDQGGVAAHKVFGGTPDEFRKTLLMKQRILIPAGRVFGSLLMVLGLVLVAPYVQARMRERHWIVGLDPHQCARAGRPDSGQHVSFGAAARIP
jgi:hypothetical protein